MESRCAAGKPVPQVFLIPNPWACPPTDAAMLRSFAIALLGALGKGEGDRMEREAWRPRKLRPFHFKSSVSTCPAIPGSCKEELKFPLLQLQQKKHKSLQLNIFESPTLAYELSPGLGQENALEGPISNCKQNLRNCSSPSGGP